MSFTQVNITSKIQVINTTASTLRKTECMLVSQMTCGPEVCAHMHLHVIELKFFISIIISHFSQRKISTVCHYALGLYHSLATNRHWAKLQKKKKSDYIYFGSLLKQEHSLLWYLAHCHHLQIQINNSKSDIHFWQNVLNTCLKRIN